jgi:hypothetical protein
MALHQDGLAGDRAVRHKFPGLDLGAQDRRYLLIDGLRALGITPTWRRSPVAQDATGNPSGSEDALKAALATVEAAHPGWQCWPGVLPPLVYARRPKPSPPMVVRAATTEALGEAIERAEAERYGGRPEGI